jgi:hypothetical protein
VVKKKVSAGPADDPKIFHCAPCPLKDPDTFWFSCFPYMDAPPTLPPFAYSHETGYQGWIEIHAIVSPVDDRIFLHAPVRFHARVSDNSGNE